MKIYIYTILVILPLLGFFSCNSDLDPAKDGKMGSEDVWKSPTRAFGFLSDAYNNLPSGYNRIDGGMLASASDEAVNSNLISDIAAFNDGRWSQYNLIEDVWFKNYEGIRKANTFLENIDKVPINDIPGTTKEQLERRKDRMIGEAYFLRALFHFELVKRYGGISIVTKTLTTEEAKVQTRASMENCVKQIVEDCEMAVSKLPKTYAGVSAGFDDKGDLGRATHGAALALKSKALLYFASPLHNPNSDIQRWSDAAKAAKEVIDLQVYRLKSFAAKESLGNIYYVSGTNFPMYNDDIIFSTKYMSSTAFERSNTPPSYGGNGYTNPTENLIRAFGMKDGKSIDAPGSTYDPLKPYLNRDPRFYMTVIYNNMTLNINKIDTEVETFEGGKDSYGKYATSTRTGYYLQKLMSNSAVWDGQTSNISRTWVIMRYSEILLNYAEALNEANDPASIENAYVALESIRKRAGLDPYTITRGMSQDDLRKLIRKERQVELAFEEHRFFDVRRWKLFDDPTERENLLIIEGVKIVKDAGGNFTYTTTLVETRKFDSKMYLYPIPQREIQKAPGLQQNPGW